MMRLASSKRQILRTASAGTASNSIGATRRMMIAKSRKNAFLTAAAAACCATLSSSSIGETAAFSVVPQQQHYRQHLFSTTTTTTAEATGGTTSTLVGCHKRPSTSVLRVGNAATTKTSTTRLFFSNKDGRGDDDDGGGGFLKKVGSAVKNLLPSKWFRSEEEKRAEIVRRQRKEEISGSIREILKDAPLPIRMLGGMVGPLLGSALSNLAQVAADQQEQIDQVLDEARIYIVTDDDVAALLGGQVVDIGRPFSQSSSTTSINGRTETRIELAFPVVGVGNNSGVARLSYADGNTTGGGGETGIRQLQVQANGRVLQVSLVKRGRKKSSKIGGSSKEDDIIEAEIIEKDTKP